MVDWGVSSGPSVWAVLSWGTDLLCAHCPASASPSSSSVGLAAADLDCRVSHPPRLCQALVLEGRGVQGEILSCSRSRPASSRLCPHTPLGFPHPLSQRVGEAAPSVRTVRSPLPQPLLATREAATTTWSDRGGEDEAGETP